MVRVASSSGVKVARGTSLEHRLTQYWQSYTQLLVISTFSSEMQRPSAAKLWQMPHPTADPSIPACPSRSTPLEVQAASYLAESASIRSLSISSNAVTSLFSQYRTYVLICQRPSSGFLFKNAGGRQTPEPRIHQKGVPALDEAAAEKTVMPGPRRSKK